MRENALPSVHRVEMDLGDRVLAIETGRLALQAHGAVTVQAGDTMCLVTVCCGSEPRTQDFFPLTVDYEERMYAAGKIPGSFFRREGRPTEKAILTSRMVDRGIRPLFPKGLRNDVQIIITALSADKENQIDILAMIGASAALAVSGIPFPTMAASMRVGLSPEDEWIIYPTHQESEETLLDLTVTATRDHITMIEAGANQVDEDTIVEGCKIAHEQCVAVIDAIEELKRKVNPTPRELPVFLPGDDVVAAAEALGARERYEAAFDVRDWAEQRAAMKEIRTQLLAELAERIPDEDRRWELDDVCASMMKKAVRRMLLEEGRRLDGRATDELRELSAAVGIAPRVHGSALFQRGQTQALNFTTLGMFREGQRLDGLTDEEDKIFLHHYNMPPFSTGEAYMMRGPSRRAIGHGALAEKALRPVLPSPEEFPYAIRLVTEVISSNGSTSMASVCSGSLSLMDTGVPISAAVGGIAMGIVYESPEAYRILTDIQGAEDHNGDMDFKVAGTRAGVTALQLDVKRVGLTAEILGEAMEQAKAARMRILDVMDACLPAPREQLSRWAPRVLSTDIDPEKIGTVIGPSGKTIRRIEEIGVTVEVQDTGRVLIGATDAEAGERALKFVRDLVRDPEPGELFENARVTRLMPFGAFCEILPGRDGLLHVSDYAWERTEDIADVLSVGDTVTVKLKEIDSQGRINLTRKELLEKPEGMPDRPERPRGGSGGSRGGPRRGGSGGGNRGGGSGRPRRSDSGGRSRDNVSFRDKKDSGGS